jgi:hypothetical protein
VAMSMGAHLYDFCWESAAGVLKQELSSDLKDTLKKVREKMEAEEQQEKIKKGEMVIDVKKEGEGNVMP